MARRLATPGRVLLTVLVAIGLAGAVGLWRLQAQVQQRSEQDARLTAQVVATVTVARNLNNGGLAIRHVDPMTRAEMDADVAALIRQNDIIGLEVWRADGSLAYADPGHPTTEQQFPQRERQRVLRGGSFALFNGARERQQTTLDVFEPYDSNHDGKIEGMVEVLLPQAPVARAITRQTRRLYALAALLGGVLLLAVWMVYRRVRARESEAQHDPLTGLANRAGLRLAAEPLLAEPATGGAHAILLIDIDDFKQVNDTLGHAAGDLLLRQVATTLRGAVRAGDTVARLGGDEFAVLLRGLPSHDKALQVAGQLLQVLRQRSFVVDGIALAVDASIGVAAFPEHGSAVQQLLQRADVAMYQAKREAVGTVLYDPANDQHDVNKLGLLVELRDAIDSGQLRLLYQPKARLADGRVDSLEALVRWQHPTRGIVSPAEFIPVAEHTGLIGPLTDWVLRQATCQCAHWHAAGCPPAVIAFLCSTDIALCERRRMHSVASPRNQLRQDRGPGRPSRGVSALHAHVGQATVEPTGQPPVRAAHQRHGRGHYHHPHDRRVEQDRC